MIDVYRVLLGKCEGKRQLGRPTRRLKIILKLTFNKWDREH